MSTPSQNNNSKDPNELEHIKEYDENGNLVKMKLSREKLFRDKWPNVIQVRFFNRKHLQRLSLYFSQNLGDRGRDWETYTKGFGSAMDIIEHNEEGEDEMVDQVFLLGISSKVKEDKIEYIKGRIQKLKLKYMIGK